MPNWYTINNPTTLHTLVMAIGLSRPRKSREGPGPGQDLETLNVPWSCGPGTKEVQKSWDIF